MADAPEAEFDQLFRLSPEAMVEARNALAVRLRKAGARALADQVKSLKRPTPAAWALNQLHFEQPTLLQRARGCAEQVRALHARDGVDARALAAAVAAQRQAIGDVMAAALERWETAGLASNASQQRKLLATVQGWLAGAGQEPPGRMTRDIEHGGFDAITAVGAPAARAPAEKAGAPHAPKGTATRALAETAGAPHALAQPTRTAPHAPAGRTRIARAPRAPASPGGIAAGAPGAADVAEARAGAAAIAERERRLRAAREQVRARQADQQRAARDLGRALDALREAEVRLDALRAASHARESELKGAQQALDAALTEQAAAEQALAGARKDAPLT